MATVLKPGRAIPHGYGRFPGQGGMAILSRLPIKAPLARDFSDFLWRDLPGSQIDATALPAGAAEILRLSTTGHWDVPLPCRTGTA